MVSVEGAESEESKAHKYDSDSHQPPLLSFPGRVHGARTEDEDNRHLQGDPGVGPGQDQVDHTPGRPTGAVATPTMLRLSPV